MLVVSAYYWPETSGNAPYVTGLAEHLAGAGYRVTVATGFPHYPSWKSSSGGRLARHELLNGVHILRRWHYVPGQQSAIRRGLYEASLFASGLTAAFWPPKHDVVIGVTPSLSGAALAAVTATITRRPYGLIVQDLVARGASQSGIPGGSRVAGMLSWLEMRLARSAGGVGVIADGFREYLTVRGVQPSRISQLRNWSTSQVPAEQRTDTRARLGWGTDEFVCLHGGNMGYKQGLENLLNAAALLGGSPIRIVLAGDGSRRQQLQAEARSQGLTNLSFLPPQAEGEYEAMLQAADLLLVNQRAQVGDMALASKLSSYFAAGVAVLGALAADSETGREILTAGGGELVPPDEPGQLSAAILRLADDASVRKAYGTSGKRYAETHLEPSAALLAIEEFIATVAQRGALGRGRASAEAAQPAVPGES